MGSESAMQIEIAAVIMTSICEVVRTLYYYKRPFDIVMFMSFNCFVARWSFLLGGCGKRKGFVNLQDQSEIHCEQKTCLAKATWGK